MPKSQFDEEIDEELAQPSPSPKSTASLSLGDAQELVAALTAISLKFGNNEKGVIATMNELLKRSDVLNAEQRDVIAPLLGELKSLLKTSQEELKSFNENAQKSLEAQIKDVIGKVDLSPLHAKISKANLIIENSASTLETKAEEIKKLAAQTKTIGFFSSFKFMLAGISIATALSYTFFSYSFDKKEEALKAKYDEQLLAKLEMFQPFEKLKQTWGIGVDKRDNREYIQIWAQDNSAQLQSQHTYFNDPKTNKKIPITYFEIPIYK